MLFNAYAGDLWRRFITYLPRHLARLAGVTGKELRAAVRIRYVKVAEYQARGVVHFHAVIRLDAPGEDYQPPPARYTAALLCDAIGQAAAAVRVPADLGASRAVLLRFGTQTDTRPIHRDTIAGTGQPLDGQAVANYIAKYATKTLTVPGLPDQRLRHLVDIEHLRCSAHYRRMITTAWQLGGKRQTGDPRFRQWAHMLGYGGHFLTKSRRYSVTFGQLRKARTDHRRQQRHPDGERDPGADLSMTPRSWSCRTWTYAGTGYTSATPGAELAVASAARAREHRNPAAVIGGQRQSLLDSKPANRRRSDASMKLPIDCLWTVEETARFLRVPKATLYQWRYLGIGPKAGRVGRHLRYDPADVIAWFRQQQDQDAA